MRIVTGVHEAFAAELIDDRAQVLVAFKAAQDSAGENILARLMDGAGQLVRLAPPIALITAGARLEDMLDVLAYPPVPVGQPARADLQERSAQARQRL